MKFNEDTASIDTLASSHTIEDLSKTLDVLESIRIHELSDGQEIGHNTWVLREAIKKQADSKIYAFHISDGLHAVQNDLPDPKEGIALYKRVGNKLTSLTGIHGDCIEFDYIRQYIDGGDINELLTGEIEVGKDFLYLPRTFEDTEYETEDDNENLGDSYTIETRMLLPKEIELLRELGINVRILNILA